MTHPRPRRWIIGSTRFFELPAPLIPFAARAGSKSGGGVGLSFAAGALLLGTAPAIAAPPPQQAQAPSAQRIGEPCVVVEIAGTRAGDLECAAQRVEEAARIARARAETARAMSVVRAGSPDVRTGVTSLSGTRLRMGGNLGVSARPDRPAAIPVNPMAPRP